MASPSVSAAACAVTIDREPVLDEFFFVSGTGFKPGTDIEFTWETGASTFTFPGPDDDFTPKGLRVSASGSFGPYDMAATEEDEIGKHRITFTDGECEATVEFEVVG